MYFVIHPSRCLFCLLGEKLNVCPQMGKLKRSYSDRLGVAMTSLRFLYDGKRIPDDATPGMLEMERWGKIELVFAIYGS